MKKNLLLVLAITTLALTSCGSSPTTDITSEDPTPTTDSIDKGSSSSSTPTHIDPPSYETDAIWFHYNRNDNNYDNYDLWLWEVKKEDSSHHAFNTGYPFNGLDDFGAIAAYPVTLWGDFATWDVAVIIREGGSAWTSQTSDIIIDMTKYTKDENGIYHLYFIEDDDTPYTDPSVKDKDVIKSSYFTTAKNITITTNHNISKYKIKQDEQEIISKTLDTPTKIIGYQFNEDQEFNHKYSVELTFEKSGKTVTKEINKRMLYTSSKFENAYNYDGELGAIYTKEKTTFKVWSPVSSAITLNIYDNGTPTSVDKVKGSDQKSEYKMTLGDKGVWEYTLEGDLAGKYYTYSVTNESFANTEIVDPYAHGAGVNGLRGMIVDFTSNDVTPDGWNDFTANIHKKEELTVYETHVADVTSSETWTGTEANRLLYSGMYESGTSYTKNDVTVKTGFDHIKELGVNAVQILPIFDQANDEVNKSFNWGYNPLNYNVIEGSYSSDPYNGYTRIKEFRKLVMEYGNAGIDIIMDVVYNHVNSALDSNFNVLMPQYYFRFSGESTLSSGSGCGNDTASEMPMFSKFIKDSTLFLASTYKLSGFRFDLMGLHDVDTMNGVVDNLQENYNKDTIVYGEPWTMSTSPSKSVTLANQSSMGKWDGFAGFNDSIRDAIKGSVFSTTDQGWANTTGNMSSLTSLNKVMKGVKGRNDSSYDPLKNVSYVSCHDNNTLYDRLIQSIEDPSILPELDVLCAGIVFTSQGITFMNAGEELLRSKSYVDDKGVTHYDSNSYNSGYKINELDYSRLITYSDVYESYKELIKLKQTLSELHYTTRTDVEENVKTSNGNDNSYFTTDIGDYKFIYVNASADQSNILDLSGYNSVIFDSLNREDGSISLSSNYKLSSNELLIVKK